MIYLYLLSFLTLIFPLAAANAEDSQEQIQASVKAAEEWLKVVDQGHYGQSWSTGSLRLQLTMPKAQWEQLMHATRAPLGIVKSRKLAGQSIAKNPKGLPAGDYMVLLYETEFENGKAAEELLTLSFGYDQKWHVLTYLLKSMK